MYLPANECFRQSSRRELLRIAMGSFITLRKEARSSLIPEGSGICKKAFSISSGAPDSRSSGLLMREINSSKISALKKREGGIVMDLSASSFDSFSTCRAKSRERPLPPMEPFPIIKGE